MKQYIVSEEDIKEYFYKHCDDSIYRKCGLLISSFLKSKIPVEEIANGVVCEHGKCHKEIWVGDSDFTNDIPDKAEKYLGKEVQLFLVKKEG